MDSVHDNGSCRLVVTELSHIKKLVAQLEVHLGESPDLCNCKHLTSQIFSLTERSIGIITSSDFGQKRSSTDVGLTPSPLSSVVDAPFKTNKKRKMMEKRTHQVRVTSGSGGGESATPVDDGHSWRKYGQKEILGAKHPRGYYRCTYRHSQGCTATKQVQRSDQDPELFDVIYLGTHTCVLRTTPPKPNPDARSFLENLSANLTVKTEGLAVPGEPKEWSAAATGTPFCFSSTPASVCLAPERSPFSVPSTSENWGVSPATSDSNHVASFAPFEAAEWRAQSEYQEVVSALVAADAPPAPALDQDLDDDLINFDISSFFA
ncbi:hypothetical protein PR202_ga16103 [Eleusine coracana subsp. coracana]|uniref:WRKY domain-containing protein n=1 Tax=Eleusine coracana subsp. coracana TaxID=191504 RepID=A0AAV5CKU3_ELECO|nr:hypothetical protein QOZ80_6AG0532600 [Eleusine coracana subsp. coracana]GJM99041.1 hypothetical protein PR202_ga16103 [Eleusine coracana subsp. coracana]